MVADSLYNQISDDSIIKYTLNIPRDTYAKLCRKTGRGTRYGGRKSTFIRELLEIALTDERLPTLAELKKLGQGEVTRPSFKFKVWWRWHGLVNKYVYHNEPAVVEVPPKRFHGFIEGLGYWPLYRRWKNKQDRFWVYNAKKP